MFGSIDSIAFMMDTENKKAYIEFCEKEQGGVMIFMQPWWLDIVVGVGNWDVCLAKGKMGEVIGALPYATQKRWGMTKIIIPYLSHFCGVWLAPSLAEKRHSQYSYVKRVLTELIEQLPKVHLFQQKYHYSLEDGQPFYWAGYDTLIRYSYLIKDLTDLKRVHGNFNQLLRSQIKTAESKVVVEETDDLELFLRVNELTFQRQGMHNPIPITVWRALDAALALRGLRTIYVAKDKETGAIHAVQYVLKDAKVAYNLAQGYDPAYSSSEASKLLLWIAIKDSAEWAETFDFEGSMLKGVEYVFRSFGAEQVAYLHVVKVKNKFLKAVEILRR